jgi:crotonobetainyl-CoA:carnitine CoA-transferase CaiB-like acyl-CoA transferase
MARSRASAHLTVGDFVATPSDNAPGPLAGLRVLDLTQALAGPFCTMLLADLGADVIKVEPPAGDMTRFVGPYTAEDTLHAYGGYFASINRGKRSIVLDLKQEADRVAVLQLAATVDVVVENSRVGVMDRLGVGYETLAALKPTLVYAAVRGFGDPRTGSSPYANWPSYDIVAQAMGGVVSLTGNADGNVMKSGPSVGDLFTGTLSAVGLLAAVIHARATGEGQFVDVAMYDAMLSLCEGAAYSFSYTGLVRRATGNGHPTIAPFDIFPTKDGHCAIGTPSDRMFATLCERMGCAGLADDDRFSRASHRLANRPALNESLVGWTMSKTTAEIVELLGGDVPVGPVNDMADIYADPHVAARRMLTEVEQPDGSRPVTLAGQPIKMTRSYTGIRTRPPLLGEHTEEILAEVGVVR